MKIQKRISVFETNSSTNHTLCIVRPDKGKTAVHSGTEITIPNFDPEDKKQLEFYEDFGWKCQESSISEYDLETKLTVLALAGLNNYDTYNFIGFMLKIQEVMTELGIHLTVDYKKLYKLADHYLYQDGIYQFIGDALSNDNIRDFLLSDDVRYASYCDEGCAEPDDEYEALENHIHELLKTYDREKLIICNERF